MVNKVIELSVEQVLLFVVLAFLLYHILGNSGYINGVVDGFSVGINSSCTNLLDKLCKHKTQKECLMCAGTHQRDFISAKCTQNDFNNYCKNSVLPSDGKYKGNTCENNKANCSQTYTLDNLCAKFYGNKYNSCRMDNGKCIGDDKCNAKTISYCKPDLEYNYRVLCHPECMVQDSQPDIDGNLYCKNMDTYEKLKDKKVTIDGQEYSCIKNEDTKNFCNEPKNYKCVNGKCILDNDNGDYTKEECNIICNLGCKYPKNSDDYVCCNGHYCNEYNNENKYFDYKCLQTKEQRDKIMEENDWNLSKLEGHRTPTGSYYRIGRVPSWNKISDPKMRETVKNQCYWFCKSPECGA